MEIQFKESTIHYQTYGTGEAVVFLHGFLENLDMWTPLVNESRSTHKVLCIDLPGHGNSECLGYVHPMELMAEAVLAVLDEEGIGEAKFIGHSMGGYVALALADLQPHRVSGLCLMNSTYEADSLEKKAIRNRSVEMAKRNYASLVSMSFTNLFAPESRISFKAAFENAFAQALKTPVQGYIAAQLGMQERQNHFNRFTSISGPKAIVIGALDSLIDAHTIKSDLKNHPVDICELSGGHMSHIEDLYNLTYFILRFIE